MLSSSPIAFARRIAIATLLLPPGWASAATPTPAASGADRPALNIYADWTVGCDNLRTCQADALVPPDGGADLLLTLKRGAQPEDIATLRVPLPEKAAKGARYRLAVDGRVVAELHGGTTAQASLPLDAALSTALAEGHRAQLLDAGGHVAGETSLAGLAATLLFIDEQQHRIGTAGALKGVGAKPDSLVPRPPEPPVIKAAPASDRAPRAISAAMATKLAAEGGADCGDTGDSGEPPVLRTFRLDATHTAVLIDRPCESGAYNPVSDVYVVGNTGTPRRAVMDAAPRVPVDRAADVPARITHGEWDPGTRTLRGLIKARGMGDCGVMDTYAWDGRRFRKVDMRVMEECRGAVDFIRVWTANVLR